MYDLYAHPQPAKHCHGIDESKTIIKSPAGSSGCQLENQYLMKTGMLENQIIFSKHLRNIR